MPVPVSFGSIFVENELGRNMRPFESEAFTRGPVITPSIYVSAINKDLPSYEHLKNSYREKGRPFPIDFSSSLQLLQNIYSRAEWASGLFILPAFNLLQIVLFSSFELVARTLGVVATRFVYAGYDNLKDRINKAFDINYQNDSPLIQFAKRAGNFLAKVAVGTVLSPIWCIGQTFSLVADVFSYSRQFIDSAIRVFNPFYWATKAYERFSHKDLQMPSVGAVVKTFVTSTLKLLPTVALVTATALTTGIAAPVAAAVKAGFGGFVAAIYASGAFATVSKFVSACVTYTDKVINSKGKAQTKFSRREADLRQANKNQGADTKGMLKSMHLSPAAKAKEEKREPFLSSRAANTPSFDDTGKREPDQQPPATVAQHRRGRGG